MSKQNQNPFKWRHFEAEIILICLRWYLRYMLSYHDLEELMAERGLSVDHTRIVTYHDYFNSEKFQVVVDALNALS